jgi:hypothetical protein
LGLKINLLKFKALGKLPIMLEEFVAYTLDLMKKTRKMSTSWNWLDLNPKDVSNLLGKKNNVAQVYFLREISVG